MSRLGLDHGRRCFTRPQQVSDTFRRIVRRLGRLYLRALRGGCVHRAAGTVEKIAARARW